MSLTTVIQNGTYAIRNVQITNDCMHESSTSKGGGALVQDIICGEFGSIDKWLATNVSGGWTIQTLDGKSSMSVNDNSIVVSPTTFSWAIVNSTTSFGVRITLLNDTTQCVTPSGQATLTTAANINMATCTGAINQDWIFEDVNDTFTIKI